MVLYYALGGGLGHLTRARAVMHTLGVKKKVFLLSASPFAGLKCITGPLKVISVPKKLSGDVSSLKRWLEETVSKISPEKIILDTFPTGIMGELCGFSFPGGPELFHVARFLRWKEYRKVSQGKWPVFKETWVVETLDAKHLKKVEKHSKTLKSLSLKDPPSFLRKDVLAKMKKFSLEKSPFWLIVHSGPGDEISELTAYAEEMSQKEKTNPRFVLVAPEKPEKMPAGISYLNQYPANLLFPFADRIISACGFNLMRQTEPFKEKHRFLPFPRRFDDQFLRAGKRRERM